MPGTSNAALSRLPADYVYTCLFEIHEAVLAGNVAMSRCTLAYCMWDKVAFVKKCTDFAQIGIQHQPFNL